MTIYTLNELSGILKMSESFLYKAAQKGRIPVIRVGRSLRFDDECIKTFLQNCREPVQPDLKEKNQ
ncbi:MAG: helix-turn-helix domain-containing protein [Lachnoclostridium sp.]|jgi:putative molybdopterin biosynthesis protein|nr:helix-turn-helix domain-containing protein [Lachnoclostridium sp.]